jgi:hypothetical protein
MPRWCVAPLFALAALAIAAAAALSSGEEPPPSPPTAPPTGGGTTTRGEALAGGAPEIAGYKDKVLFVVDRSGSMGIGDRFLRALDILDQLLVEMPKDTKFDVILADESGHSLFGEGEWLRPAGDVRKALRQRIATAGGLNYGGFTDLCSVLKVAVERRRPDAVYLFSDGVATLGELDTEKIIGAVVKVSLSVKIPIHTIAVGVGQDLAEDGAQATLVLKGIAEGTGGIFREVKSETRSRGRAFLLPPPWQPPLPEELVRIHLRNPRGKEFWNRYVSYSAGRSGDQDVLVDIEDPALKLGSIESSHPCVSRRMRGAHSPMCSAVGPACHKHHSPISTLASSR